MDKAQKSEKTNCSNGPQDAKSLEKTFQLQMVIFLAALCVAVVGMAAGAHLLQVHERTELAAVNAGTYADPIYLIEFD